jgi:hypothetical protein
MSATTSSGHIGVEAYVKEVPTADREQMQQAVNSITSSASGTSMPSAA